MKDKIPALTSLRFFAAAAIVYYHSMGHVVANPNSTWALGVSFFFVLSGFILTYAYGNHQGKWVARFYLSRFARIWPVHIVTMVAAMILIYFIQYPGFPIDPALFFENLFLLHAWHSTVASVFSYNAVSWSLSVEVAFYMLFPLIIRVKHVEAIYVVALVVTLAGVAVVSQYPLVMPADPYKADWLNFVLQNPVSRMPEFLIGVVAARWHAKTQTDMTTFRATCFEIATLVLLSAFVLSSPLSLNLRPRLPGAFEQWAQQSGGMLIFAAMIFVFASSSGYISRALSWSPLVFLGEISFCTYMVHHLMLRYVAVFGTPFNTYTFAVIIPTIYGVSYLMWRYVERPSRTAIVSLSAAPIAARPAQAAL